MMRAHKDLLRITLVSVGLACVGLTSTGVWTPLAAQSRPVVEPASQEAPALLVADTIVVTPEEQLIAEGSVEVLYDGSILRARRVIYDRASDRITLEGPLRIEQPDGTILLAQGGSLDAGLKDGLLRGARLILERQLQLAGVQLARVEGRYSMLSRAALTSCQICGTDGVPLWEIRSNRIIHDDVERQIYIDGAQLRVLDVPVFYVPRLRMPDPTLKRSRGFLYPTMRQTSKLGLGIKIPYFLPIGPHRDLTLTPYLSRKTTTLEGRYRQAFRTGDIIFRGAATRDSLRSGKMRGYLFGEGTFDLGRNLKLKFDVELTTDRGYLKEYDYSSKDRLDSAISLQDVRRNRLSEAKVVHYYSLLDSDKVNTLPAYTLDLTHQQRHFPKWGGELRMGAELHGHYRYSEKDTIGRDVLRTNASILWRNDWITDGGLQLTVQGGLNVDAVRNRGDSTVPTEDAVIAPEASLRLRYPLLASNAQGARFLIEPLVQLGWTGGEALKTANDESQRVDFDEGNLLSLSRYPANDRRERGWAAAFGLRWAVQSPSGLRAGLTVGRVIREEKRNDFSVTSGLSNATSDWLIAGRLSTDTGLDLIARALVDDTADINRAEARAVWSNRRLDLAASYILLPKDLREDRSDLVSEWSFDGSYRVSRHWRASAKWQYDLGADRTASGGIGLEYQNECVIARFTADRDFADSDNLDPTTSYALTVELKGFGTGRNAGGYRRVCSN